MNRGVKVLIGVTASAAVYRFIIIVIMPPLFFISPNVPNKIVVYAVHFQQVYDRREMRKGVERDIERLKMKKLQLSASQKDNK